MDCRDGPKDKVNGFGITVVEESSEEHKSLSLRCDPKGETLNAFNFFMFCFYPCNKIPKRNK